MIHERAGLPATPADLVDVAHLVSAYYTVEPDVDDTAQRVAFGTSGHRGSSLTGAFNDAHIAATTQAICEYRAMQSIDGPLFLGRDTHALSEPAWTTALEVLAANDVTVFVDADGRYTPTPAVSHAILRHNGGRTTDRRPTASSSPRRTTRPGTAASSTTRPTAVLPTPTPPDGSRPAPTNCWPTGTAGSAACRSRGRSPPTPPRYDYRGTYVDDLPSVLDLDAIRGAGVRIGADPLGGASVDYWGRIADTHDLDLTVVNPLVDPTWRFMTLDWDGAIRMDCSSPHAMASLIEVRDRYQIATGNDADADRHGIVTPDGGLMNPNHFLAVAIDYVFSHRDRLAARPRDRQDARVVVDDRPGRRGARSDARRGAGRVQVVRSGAARRVDRLRRRGVRRRVVPAPRRHGLDHRQGRHPARPARRPRSSR